MNIIFVSLRSPLSYLGGAEILTQVIAESLVQLGHRVVIYTAGFGGQHEVRGVRIQETPLLAFPLRFRTTLMPLYSFFLHFLFSGMRDFYDADIVHATDSDAIMLMSGWSFLKYKFVVTIQDYTLIWPAKDYFSMGVASRQPHNFFVRCTTSIRKKATLGTVSRLQYAVCVSAFVANEVRKVNPSIKLAVIGNCVSPVWETYKVPKQRDIDILYVGKLMPYKGLDVLLRAIALMQKKQHFRVVVIGEGLGKRYAALATRLGIAEHITFTGPLAHALIPTYYLRSKIVVSPSIWPEPCGRSIIEAMWMGCAVVATSVGGTPESLVDGTHGYLVPPGKAQAIAEACWKLLLQDTTRERLGKQAARFAYHHYSSDRIAREYERFYTLIKSH